MRRHLLHALALATLLLAAAPIHADIPPPSAVTYDVPTRLRLVRTDHGPSVSYTRADTVPHRVVIIRGAYLGARITRDGGAQVLLGGGVRPLARPDDPSPVDGLFDYRGGAVDHTYLLEIFQTDEPPGHKWNPEARGYRVVWSTTLVARFPAADVQRILAP